MAEIGHNRPPSRVRLSDQMREVLRLAKAGRSLAAPLVDGKGSQSRTVGRGATIEALQRHGLLDRECNPTPSGLEALERGSRCRD